MSDEYMSNNFLSKYSLIRCVNQYTKIPRVWFQMSSSFITRLLFKILKRLNLVKTVNYFKDNGDKEERYILSIAL